MRAQRPLVGPVGHHAARLAFARIGSSPLVARSLHRREHVHNVTDVKQSVDVFIQHDRFAGRSVMVWGGISLVGSTNLHVLANCTLTDVKYRDEILGPIVRLLVQWALGSFWCRTMPGLMWPECVGSSWMKKALMPLTGPHIPQT